MSNVFHIEAVTASTIEAATEVRLASWLETYVSAEYGVTTSWIQRRNEEQRTETIKRKRLEQLSDPAITGWVAVYGTGKVIGVAMQSADSDGTQRLGSLYVEKSWHGRGVAAALMQTVISRFDSEKPIELGVVTYNHRARAFYRKWGFIEVPDSETLFADKIPEIKMIRQPVSSVKTVL